ncbi:MAG: purine-nucleoside phosphorylase [Oscillospiraceae bacterium]|nr:purine-nucleoside phosphorylase [Oscillospiraceae bacterium]
MDLYNFEFYKKSADYVKERLPFTPEIAIILGSSLGSFGDEIENPVVIDYKDIPNFLVSTAPFHAGKLIAGTVAGKKVICMSGRFHVYEGYEFEQLVIPIRLFKLLGVEKTILTNASGAINKEYGVGDVMIISDHIKIFGHSPLRGPNVDEFGERFFEMRDVYTPALREIARKCGENSPLTIREGVYMFFEGPQYETVAEAKMARLLGADVVGMSTVVEAITAAHCGMPILGLSVVTALPTDVLEVSLSAEEVDKAAKLVEENFSNYVKDIVANM